MNEFMESVRHLHCQAGTQSVRHRVEVNSHGMPTPKGENFYARLSGTGSINWDIWVEKGEIFYI
jgi:hypothetical protein